MVTSSQQGSSAVSSVSASRSESSVQKAASLSIVSSVTASIPVSNSAATPSATAPVNHILFPVRDPAVDRTKSSNLSPANAQTLYYAERLPGTYAMSIRAIFSSSDKAILLENIATAGNPTCDSNQIIVNFADSGSANIAKTWPAGTILITSTDSCNTAEERGVYVISKASGVTPPGRRIRATSNVVTFTVTKSSLKDIADELDISYGQLVSDNDGSQSTSYTTTVTSYFTHSRMGTMTSSVFVSTVTASVASVTPTSLASSVIASSSSSTPSSSLVMPSSSSDSDPISPSAQALANALSAKLPAPGPDGTVTFPVKKGGDQVVVLSGGSEPFNTDAAYQTVLQNAMEADHLDTPATLLDAAVDGLGGEDSNVTPDSPVKLGTSDYAGTDDATYENAPPVQVVVASKSTKRFEPARAASAPAPRAAVVSTDVSRLATRSLQKRDGWDTFFDVMGDDLIGEICEICGAM